MAKGKPRQNLKHEDIPQISAQPVFKRRLRFRNSNAGEVLTTLRSDELFNSCGMIAEGFSRYPIAFAVKVRRITIWGAPKSDTSGAFSQIDVDWHNSTSFASGKKYTDCSISNAHPAYLTCKPPPNSVCNLWMQSTGIQYCEIRVPEGAIIDLDVSYTLADDLVHSFAGATNQATALFVMGYLDQNNFLKPVGNNSVL